VLVGCALVVLALAGWYFGVELPEQRAARELAWLRAANARTIPDLKLDLVWIAPGDFLMGTPTQNAMSRWFYEARKKLTGKPNPEGETVSSSSTPPTMAMAMLASLRSTEVGRPVTWVTLTRAFWLGRTEVSQAQWQAVMGSNPSGFSGDDLPVETVSWDAAMEFCRKLTERERAANRLPAGYAYTLPTEAQWEYACRAGTTGDYTGTLDAISWYTDNSAYTTHPVGTKQANAWGLFDMQGNVTEWCLNWYGSYPGGSVTNPSGPASASPRVTRGGGWNFSVDFCRPARRFRSASDSVGKSIGFRVALVPVR
jgi:formylglycine-generating enzyme required for sulfatase activity